MNIKVMMNETVLNFGPLEIQYIPNHQYYVASDLEIKNINFN